MDEAAHCISRSARSEGLGVTNGSSSLSTSDHSRDSAGMTYVYAVVSRRAGGVSVGINLNPNNACNWRCIYCQVPDLRRGGPPPIDLASLRSELERMLDEIVRGDFMRQRVAEGARRLIDVAFSGNGEPTSAREFPEAVAIAADVLRQRGLTGDVKLRLITNGSLVHRRSVRDGLALLGETNGEVWFKVDGGDARTIARINGTRIDIDAMRRRLRSCCVLCPTWVQTCLFTLDEQPLAQGELDALVGFLGGMKDVVRGVFLYGLARPSAQAEAARLGTVSAAWLNAVAERLRNEGLTVVVKT